MSNILYYIPFSQKESGGIYQYSFSLLSILANSDHQLYVYHLKPDNEFLDLIRMSKNLNLVVLEKESNDPIFVSLIRDIVLKIANKSLTILNSKYRIQLMKKEINIIDSIIIKYNIDIIHCPLQSIGVSSLNIPTITTLHDVQELHLPEFFTSEIRALRASWYKEIIEKSDAVIVSYEHVKNDIYKYFGKPLDKIHVCLLDMQSLWFNQFCENDIVELKEYAIPENFVLYPASTWEHKNHLRLIEAIYYLKKEKNVIINLICTSHKTGFYDIIEKKIEELQLQNQILFLGTMSEIELFSLYKKAKAVVIPTLYEAGSFPLMESIIMKVPVVCSNVTSLPETIGNLNFTFNPLDVYDIADKILKILKDNSYIEKNLLNSEIQSKKFIKKDTVNKVNAIYANVIKMKLE